MRETEERETDETKRGRYSPSEYQNRQQISYCPDDQQSWSDVLPAVDPDAVQIQRSVRVLIVLVVINL